MRELALFLSLAVLAPIALTACDDAQVPVGPPRCEPPDELVLERGLKRGFRALAEGDRGAARGAFEAVLGREAQHPEALAGMRALSGHAPRRDADTADSGGSGGTVVVAGAARRVALPINTERYRFEEMRAQARLAKEMGLDHSNRAIHGYFRERRDNAEAPIDPGDADAVASRVDLVVLHDSLSQTARASHVRLADGGGSSHFTIDYDGQVYQNLDVAWEATHSGDAAIDARSISVDLVNPVTVDHPPLPADAKLDRFARPLSDFVAIHGRELQHWSYTAPQLESLTVLLRELVRIMPRLPAKVPQDGRAPRAMLRDRATTFQGVIGHLHVSPRAVDPGAGFDWVWLAETLSGP